MFSQCLYCWPTVGPTMHAIWVGPIAVGPNATVYSPNWVHWFMDYCVIIKHYLRNFTIHPFHENSYSQPSSMQCEKPTLQITAVQWGSTQIYTGHIVKTRTVVSLHAPYIRKPRRWTESTILCIDPQNSMNTPNLHMWNRSDSQTFAFLPNCI